MKIRNGNFVLEKFSIVPFSEKNKDEAMRVLHNSLPPKKISEVDSGIILRINPTDDEIKIYDRRGLQIKLPLPEGEKLIVKPGYSLNISDHVFIINKR